MIKITKRSSGFDLELGGFVQRGRSGAYALFAVAMNANGADDLTEIARMWNGAAEVIDAIEAEALMDSVVPMATERAIAEAAAELGDLVDKATERFMQLHRRGEK